MNKYNNVILVNGVPRSGTSWLGQIIDSSPNVRYKFQPLFSNSFKDAVNKKSSKNEIETFFSKLYDFEDDFLDRTHEKRKGIHINFQKKKKFPEHLAIKHVRYHYLLSHFLKLIENIKVICIVRNPCATLNSWRKSPKEFRDIDGKFDDQWRFAQKRNEFDPGEYFGFHKWKEAAKIFLTIKEWYPQKVKILRYEDLVTNLYDEVMSLFEFLELKMEDQTIKFLDESTSKHNNDVYSVFKGNKNHGEWSSELNKDIIHQVDKELENSEFEQFLK